MSITLFSKLVQFVKIKNAGMFFLPFVLLAYPSVYAQEIGQWVEIDSLLEEQYANALVLLPNGNILVTGGELNGINKTASEIYNFETGKWRYTSPMNAGRDLHNLVVLDSNRVLAIGGYKERSCEIYNIGAETWTLTDSIPTMRYYGQSVMKLRDGKILVVGGYRRNEETNQGESLSNSEIFDPETNKWEIISSLNIGRYNHTASLLNSGRVLVAGGGVYGINACEIYDPVADTWLLTNPMNEGRSDHAAVLLPDGKVFISGGQAPSKRTCEIFDPEIEQWNYCSNMIDYRSGHLIYYLHSLKRLIIFGGAVGQSTIEDTWEIYDPIALSPVSKGVFPIKKIYTKNTVLTLNDEIALIGGEDFDLSSGIPVAWAARTCFLLSVITDVYERDPFPDGYALSQNYPNPFNPTTTINYALPIDANVTLKIYNIVGKEIKSFSVGNKSAGVYSITWDGTNESGEPVSSGTYIYRFTALTPGGTNQLYSKSGKMVLLK